MWTLRPFDARGFLVPALLPGFVCLTPGGSPWYNIETTYGQSATAGPYVSNAVTYVAATTITSSSSLYLGTSLSDANIETVVTSVLAAGLLANDANGVYFVLTAPEVTATSGFCSQYCGWHTSTGSGVRYAFVGNAATQCLGSCAQSTGPNGNAGADGMASVIAHELAETVSDPDGGGWYDR